MTREEALEEIRDTFTDEYADEIIQALDYEPFINKPCVSSEVCEHDKQKVLDKLRAEIEEYIDCMRWNDSESFIKLATMNYVLELIDKYKSRK